MQKKLQVLLIEDNRSLSSTLQEEFSEAGMAITATWFGKEGLDLGLAGTFDVIVVDLTLPDVDGLQILRCLKLACVPGHVIIITGNANKATALEARRLGATRFYEKPFLPAVLATDILSMTGRRQPGVAFERELSAAC